MGLAQAPKAKRKWILHPFLFAAYASLTLIANNFTDIGWGGARAILLSIALAALVFVIFRLILKDSVKAGLCTSGLIVLVILYGHVFTILQNLLPAVFSSRKNLLLPTLWILLFGLWTYWVVKRSKHVEFVSNYLNIMALIVIIMPIYTIATSSRRYSDIPSLTQEYMIQNQMDLSGVDVDGSGLSQQEDFPDIYFIVLDAYTRMDVLEDLYNYDNTEFINFLEERDFYVNEWGRANYTYTEYSIATSLNMTHIHTLPEFLRTNAHPDDEDSIRIVAREMVARNAAKDVFRDLGYTFVAFDSGYDPTQVRDADVFVSSPEIEDMGVWQIGFELMLLDTTFGRELINLLGDANSPHRRLFDAHRERVLFTLEEIPDFAEKEGTFFLYAHIVSPHVPYVFGPNGEEITGHDPYTLLDAQPGNEANIGLYRDQVHYINTLVVDTVEEILQKSDPTPIIIIQADHGSKVYNDVDPPTPVKMDLLLPILNAILLPDAPEDLLYPGITPVNNFRLILNQLFGADLELLDDHSYILEVEDGHNQFVDACEKYQACP